MQSDTEITSPSGGEEIASWIRERIDADPALAPAAPEAPAATDWDAYFEKFEERLPTVATAASASL